MNSLKRTHTHTHTHTHTDDAQVNTSAEVIKISTQSPEELLSCGVDISNKLLHSCTLDYLTHVVSYNVHTHTGMVCLQLCALHRLWSLGGESKYYRRLVVPIVDFTYNRAKKLFEDDFPPTVRQYTLVKLIKIMGHVGELKTLQDVREAGFLYLNNYISLCMSLDYADISNFIPAMRAWEVTGMELSECPLIMPDNLIIKDRDCIKQCIKMKKFLSERPKLTQQLENFVSQAHKRFPRGDEFRDERCCITRSNKPPQTTQTH
eukprot:GHVR01049338.1.p1 GENE.GHVR01049338.1~~GHVR01049338.1.p1  ORF type:complete len:262 (-),score=82.69 GHVR01049338.1:8-793(-)